VGEGGISPANDDHALSAESGRIGNLVKYSAVVVGQLHFARDAGLRGRAPVGQDDHLSTVFHAPREDLPVSRDFLDPFLDKVDAGALGEIHERLRKLVGAHSRARSRVIVDLLVGAPAGEDPPPAVSLEDRRAEEFSPAVGRRGKSGRTSPNHKNIVFGLLRGRSDSILLAPCECFRRFP
jgi:hypothetical protein